MNTYKLGLFVLLILLAQACGVQVAPGEIQFFGGGAPAVTATPWPTPTLPPTATPIATAPPSAAYTVVPAAIPVPPAPPPITNAKDVSIIKYTDSQSVLVLVDGVEYTLPYATLPPPPPQPKVQPTPALDWDSRLNGLGIWVSRAQGTPGQPVFRLVKAYYEDEAQAGGLHHIYVEVLDEKGQRLVGQPVTQSWSNGQAVGYTENKPAPEYALNFPMYGAQGADNYSIYVTGAASDVVQGLGLPGGHLINYRLTFQRQ